MTEQFVVQRARCQTCHAVVQLALQQQPNLHAALRGFHQGAAERTAGVKVGRNQIDPCARAAYCVDVAVLDGAALTHVVAQQKGGLHGLHV